MGGKAWICAVRAEQVEGKHCLGDETVPFLGGKFGIARGESSANPSLSTHTDINGNFDFNTTPLAPPGTKVLDHEAASNMPSF